MKIGTNWKFEPIETSHRSKNVLCFIKIFLSQPNLGWILPKYYWLKKFRFLHFNYPPNPNPWLEKGICAKVFPFSFNLFFSLFLQLSEDQIWFSSCADIVWKVKVNGPNLSHLLLRDSEEGCINLFDGYCVEYYTEDIHVQMPGFQRTWVNSGQLLLAKQMKHFILSPRSCNKNVNIVTYGRSHFT